MSKTIKAASIFSTRANGWTAEILMAQVAKKDGSANLARSPRAIGVEIHRHESGAVRVYKDGCLSIERDA